MYRIKKIEGKGKKWWEARPETLRGHFYYAEAHYGACINSFIIWIWILRMSEAEVENFKKLQIEKTGKE